MNKRAQTALAGAMAVAFFFGVCAAAHAQCDPQQITKLVAADGAARDVFGNSVCVDGETAIVGAVWDDDRGTESGSAYVFVRDGIGWTQQAKLLAPDGGAYDHFGSSVSLSGDTALIGAPGDDHLGEDSGSAYVYVRTGTIWTLQAKLIALAGPTSATSDWFGNSVSVSGDTALIGARLEDDPVLGINAGSAYVFVRDGSTWTQQARLTAADGAPGDGFGQAVSVDGNTAVLGTWGDADLGEYSGSAYVFVRDGSIWTQQAKLLAFDGARMDNFGTSVSVSGNTVMVGSGNAEGKTYMFVREGGSWLLQAQLLGPDLSGFGGSVSVSGDVALVGAPSDDATGPYSDTGSAFVFVRRGSTWSQQAKLIASDAAIEDWFGRSVFTNGNSAIVGAREYTSVLGTEAGAAYVFDLHCSCAADLDGDGQAGVFDLLEYLSLWFDKEPAADVDGAAGLDIFDLLTYLDWWFVGCE